MLKARIKRNLPITSTSAPNDQLGKVSFLLNILYYGGSVLNLFVFGGGFWLQRDGSGCDFWYWEEDYEKIVGAQWLCPSFISVCVFTVADWRTNKEGAGSWSSERMWIMNRGPCGHVSVVIVASKVVWYFTVPKWPVFIKVIKSEKYRTKNWTIIHIMTTYIGPCMCNNMYRGFPFPLFSIVCSLCNPARCVGKRWSKKLLILWYFLISCWKHIAQDFNHGAIQVICQSSRYWFTQEYNLFAWMKPRNHHVLTVASTFIIGAPCKFLIFRCFARSIQFSVLLVLPFCDTYRDNHNSN